ncbi:MAG: hypothetical protein Q9170_001464 [Blastenia crenularia]
MPEASAASLQEARVIRTLVELHPDERIYQGVDRDGGLSFRQRLREGHQGTKAVRAQGLIALGLTEACCDIGVGKVYHVPMLDAFPEVWGVGPPTEEYERTLTVTNGFYRIPRLLYTSVDWTPQERQDWMAMKHENRLAVLNARGGAVPQGGLVMPINLQYEPLERVRNTISDMESQLLMAQQEHFKVTAHFSGLRGYRAFLAIVPKAYLTWNVDFDRLSCGYQLMDRGVCQEAWGLMDPSTLHEYLMTDAERVVRKLDEMFFAEKERSLTLVSDVLRAVNRFYRAYQGDHDGDGLPPDYEEGPLADRGEVVGV